MKNSFKKDEKRIRKLIDNDEGKPIKIGSLRAKYVCSGQLHCYYAKMPNGEMYQALAMYEGTKIPKDYRNALSYALGSKYKELLCEMNGHPDDKVLDDKFCMFCEDSL
jgi:hypothetical protein